MLEQSYEKAYRSDASQSMSPDMEKLNTSLNASSSSMGLWMEIRKENEDNSQLYDNIEVNRDHGADDNVARYQSLNIEANDRAEVKNMSAVNVVENETLAISLVVPDRDMGRLIGKGGSFISQIRERSGSKIQAQDRRLLFQGPGFGEKNPQRLFKAFGDERALQAVIIEVAKKLSSIRRERACDIAILCPKEQLPQGIEKVSNVSVLDQGQFSLVIIEGYLNVVTEVSAKVLALGIGKVEIDEKKLITHKNGKHQRNQRAPQQRPYFPQQNMQQPVHQPQYNDPFRLTNQPAVVHNPVQHFGFNAQGQQIYAPQQSYQREKHGRRGRRDRRRRDRSRSRSPAINKNDTQDFLKLLGAMMNGR